MGALFGGGDSAMGPFGQNFGQQRQLPPNLGGGTLPNGTRVGGFGSGQMYPGGNVNGKLPGMPGYGGQTGGGGIMGPNPGGAGPSGTNFGGFGGGQMYPGGNPSGKVPNYAMGVPQPAPTQQPGIGSITTSVQPSPIYTPQMTQQAVNQARANADQMADPRWQEKQFMAPGRSMDAGTLGAAMPGIAGAQFQGQQQAAQIPLMDAFANQQQMLNGQIGQQNESNGLANALAQFNENNINQQNSIMNPLLALFGNYMGGF